MATRPLLSASEQTRCAVVVGDSEWSTVAQCQRRFRVDSCHLIPESDWVVCMHATKISLPFGNCLSPGPKKSIRYPGDCCNKQTGSADSLIDYSAAACQSYRHPLCWLFGFVLLWLLSLLLVEVLLYLHRNCRLIRDGSPGRPPSDFHTVPELCVVWV